MFSAPRKPTIFLHIGTEKTGTSTVQELFLRHRDNAAAMGLYYPAMPLLASTGAHFGLVHYVAGAGDCPPTFRGMDARFEAGSDSFDNFKRNFVAALRDEIAAAGCPRVLMSSEHLSSSLRSQATVDRVIATLREISDDIRVLVYLRPQYELLPSAYSTGVKGGRTTACRTPRASDHFFNYDRLLGLWENAVGRDRIIVRLFNRREFKGGDFLGDFFDAIGLPLPAWAATAKTLNTRLSAEALEFLRIVNIATQTSAENHKQERQAMDRHSLVLALERYPDNGGLVVSADVLDGTDQLFLESNKAVASRYFPGRAAPLFARYERPKGDGSAASLTPERAVEIALHLWQSRTDTLAETRADLRRHRNVVARAGLKVPVKPPSKAAAAE